jgi:hypothetical protein
MFRWVLASIDVLFRCEIVNKLNVGLVLYGAYANAGLQAKAELYCNSLSVTLPINAHTVQKQVPNDESHPSD